MVILGSFSPSIELSGLWGHFTIRFEGSFWDYSSSYFWLKQILPQYPKVHPTLSIFIETTNFYKKIYLIQFQVGVEYFEPGGQNFMGKSYKLAIFGSTVII